MRMIKPREVTDTYRLDRVLKSGRSGIVFKAASIATNSLAAIKLIAPGCPADIHICQEQFLEAMEVLQAVAPRSFPALIEYGFTPDGSAFMVMELLDAEPLDALGGATPQQVLTLLVEAVDGLEALAAKGIAHGNLTPSNLHLRRTPGGERVALLGFGTAAFRVFMGELSSALLAGESMDFAAPELTDAKGTMPRADLRSDLYSLARVAAHLLKARVIERPGSSPRVELPADVCAFLIRPESLRDVLVRCLAPQPEQRPATWAELRTALLETMGESAEPPSPQLPVAATAEVPVTTQAMPVPSHLAEPVAGQSQEQVAAGATVALPLRDLPGFPARPPLEVQSPPPAPPSVAPPPASPPPSAPVFTGPVAMESTLAVPVHRLMELPVQPTPASPPAADATPPPAESVAPVPPQEPRPEPTTPAGEVVRSTVPEAAPVRYVEEGPPALYDTDKGRVLQQAISAVARTQHQEPTGQTDEEARGEGIGASGEPVETTVEPPPAAPGEPPALEAVSLAEVPASVAPGHEENAQAPVEETRPIREAPRETTQPVAVTPAPVEPMSPAPRSEAPPPQPVPVSVPALPTAAPRATPPPLIRPAVGEATRPVVVTPVPVMPPPVVAPPPPAPPSPVALAEPVLEPVVEPSPAPVAAAPAHAVPAKAAPRRKRSLWPLWVVLGIVVLAGAGLSVLWYQSSQAEQAVRNRPTPTPLPAPPTAVPKPQEPPRILEQVNAAYDAIAANDLKAAQEALEQITPVDEAQLSVADLQRLQRIREAYAELRTKTLGTELTRSLAAGNLRALGRLVASLSREEEATLRQNPDKAQALDEARRALNIQKLMLAADKAGNTSEVLQQSLALLGVVRNASQAAELRDKAAAAFEKQAQDAADRGEYDLALERLETLNRIWSARPGLAARLERLKAEREADRKASAMLAAVEQTERDKVPEKGLAMLAEARVAGRWEGRVREVRERLKAQLVQLDPSPPKIEITKGVKVDMQKDRTGALEFEKDKVGIISLQVTDDHGLKSVKCMARPQGNTSFIELRVSKGSGNTYTVEVAPGFHKNETTQFYILASDYSDHVTQLGSAEKPWVIRKKKFLGIF